MDEDNAMGRYRTKRLFFGQGIRTGNKINRETIASLYVTTETNSINRTMEPFDSTRKTGIILSGESLKPQAYGINEW